MSDKILRKVKVEVELLMLIAAISIALSAFIILDAYVVFIDFWQYGTIGSLLRVCEFVFAVSWLLLSTKFIFNVQKLRQMLGRPSFGAGVSYSIWDLVKEQKKVEVDVAEVVRDLIAFYRTYYLEVKALLVLAVAVSFSIIALATYLLIYEDLLFWDVFYRWLINVFLLLGATALYVYVHKSWGEKLLEVRDGEKKLSEMLGGPVEA